MMSSDEKRAPLPKLSQGFRERTLKTARIASRLGGRAVKKALWRKAPAATPESSRDLDRLETLVDQLDSLKGLAMKFGQMASYLNPSLSPQAQHILARLQSHSRAVAFEQIDEVFRGDFGRSATEIFEHIDPEPFAAASIGQVHRAIFDGQPVAVKVQYPGMDQLLRSDFRALGPLMKVMLAFSPLDAKALLEELRSRIGDECDYQKEAQNQQRFATLIDEGRACVPRIVNRASSRRVLTSEYIDGWRFSEFCNGAGQQKKNEAAQTIFHTSAMCIFRWCFYNADPHPGNYLFKKNGQVCFIDFGCVKIFDEQFMRVWKRLARIILNDQKQDFRDAFIEAKLVTKPQKFDFDYQWEIMKYLYRPFTSAKPFTFTNEYVAKSYNLLIFSNPNKFRTALPADWLFVNRLQWGLNSILAHLHATAPWGDIWREAIESNTEPIVGRSSD